MISSYERYFIKNYLKTFGIFIVVSFFLYISVSFGYREFNTRYRIYEYFQTILSFTLAYGMFLGIGFFERDTSKRYIEVSQSLPIDRKRMFKFDYFAYIIAAIFTTGLVVTIMSFMIYNYGIFGSGLSIDYNVAYVIKSIVEIVTTILVIGSFILILVLTCGNYKGIIFIGFGWWVIGLMYLAYITNIFSNSWSGLYGSNVEGTFYFPERYYISEYFALFTIIKVVSLVLMYFVAKYVFLNRKVENIHKPIMFRKAELIYATTTALVVTLGAMVIGGTDYIVDIMWVIADSRVDGVDKAVVLRAMPYELNALIYVLGLFLTIIIFVLVEGFFVGSLSLKRVRNQWKMLMPVTIIYLIFGGILVLLN